MNIKTILRKIFKSNKKDIKKLESKSSTISNVDSILVYQDSNIKNIYHHILGGNPNEINYDNQANYIRQIIKDDDYYKSRIELISNITNLYIIDADIDIIKLLEVCVGFTGRISIKRNKENFYLLLSGSIADYKKLIKYSTIDNEITQAVIESMYQTNSLYFEDMKDIMDMSLFVNDDNTIRKYRPEEFEYGTLYDVTPIKCTYDALKSFGFTLRDVFTCSSILYKEENNMDMKKIFLFDLYDDVNPIENKDIESIRNKFLTEYPILKEYLKPIYKGVEDDTKSYDEIDEPIGEIEEETFDVKKELIYEDENGDIHYDEANFL